ncbi:hypothetical protein A3C96_02415 [Candidatus Uhrbacteria bacterium RIFCSPHIGHO2_02_FULL_60_10]|uniref:Uncharacterized protein n=1 Tax=Candidatus Uhrbacteria bacterium RIFCSPHIGHO2_02_FULL_60_10 TaxID=1802392 RepID=A0A1F7U561_9BACT|nr:MAG: hypothetical protein A3C96_02415 [Candidatus Uhrbacteria bacterium RIFCSPHIGHO2_02_FULL_60_10]
MNILRSLRRQGSRTTRTNVSKWAVFRLLGRDNNSKVTAESAVADATGRRSPIRGSPPQETKKVWKYGVSELVQHGLNLAPHNAVLLIR